MPELLDHWNAPQRYLGPSAQAFLSAGCGHEAPFTCGHFPGFQTKSLIAFPPPNGFLGLLWSVPALSHLLGADTHSLLAQAWSGGRECNPQKRLLLREALDPCSSSKTVLEVLMVAWSLKENIWHLPSKEDCELWAMSWEWRGLFRCTLFTRMHLNPGESWDLGWTAVFSLPYLAGLGNSPNSGFGESPSEALNSTYTHARSTSI